MRGAFLGACLLGSIVATSAAGGVIVLSRGVGRDCYRETLIAPNPMRNIEALAVCDRAIEDGTASSTDHAAAYVNRADILLKMGRYQDALSDSDSGIAINPNLGVAYLNRGAGLVGLGRGRDALGALDQAIGMNIAALPLAYFDRGMAKESVGDIKGAYFDYQKAAELDPGFRLAADQLTRFTVTKH